MHFVYAEAPGLREKKGNSLHGVMIKTVQTYRKGGLLNA